jgi:hypothetical protein
MNKQDAIETAANYGIPLDADFHALDSYTVERILAAADSVKYRKPINANGSRARYFHSMLRRKAGK